MGLVGQQQALFVIGRQGKKRGDISRHCYTASAAWKGKEGPPCQAALLSGASVHGVWMMRPDPVRHPSWFWFGGCPVKQGLHSTRIRRQGANTQSPAPIGMQPVVTARCYAKPLFPAMAARSQPWQ
jgi:hypothetical protein